MDRPDRSSGQSGYSKHFKLAAFPFASSQGSEAWFVLSQYASNHALSANVARRTMAEQIRADQMMLSKRFSLLVVTAIVLAAAPGLATLPATVRIDAGLVSGVAGGTAGMVGRLVVDGWYVTEDISITLAEGRHNRVDLMAGSNKDSYWVNFASSGNPNGAGLPVWAALQSTAHERMILGPKIEMGPALDAARVALFNAVAIRRSGAPTAPDHH